MDQGSFFALGAQLHSVYPFERLRESDEVLPSCKAQALAQTAEVFLANGSAPQMYLKSAIFLMWLSASYVLLVFVAQTWWQALPLASSGGRAESPLRHAEAASRPPSAAPARDPQAGPTPEPRSG